MLERYTAVDVETPNRNNDSICSIGIVHMEYGAPVYRREFLVNPREHFDDYNIKIHGITPGMVADAPLFPEIWPEIEPFFHGIMAAHSAAFDLGVICKSLAVYGLPIPEITYICSLQKSKKHIPKELYGSHKLNDLCAGLKLPLEHHHDSLDDALGCALIIENLVDRFGVGPEDIRSISTREYSPPYQGRSAIWPYMPCGTPWKNTEGAACCLQSITRRWRTGRANTTSTSGIRTCAPAAT